MSNDEDPIVTGRNGKPQRKRRTRRKLFGKKAKAAFLESFACTANAAASAEAVGFAVGTVFTHRRTDAEFRELYWVAFEQALGKLVALRVQREIERAEGTLDPAIEARMDGPPDARQIADLVKLMQAMRDLTRNLGGGERRGGEGAAPQHAGLDEVCAALAKRLKAFPPTPEASDGSALALPSPSHPADAGRAPPSPLEGEGDKEASDEQGA
ncbi:MAG TPA: hypothetical protein VF718_13005 [Allosphingosinicella sp.]|jgi:hypothetical protein